MACKTGLFSYVRMRGLKEELACMTSHHVYEDARAPAVLMGAAPSLGRGLTSRGGVAAANGAVLRRHPSDPHDVTEFTVPENLSRQSI